MSIFGNKNKPQKPRKMSPLLSDKTEFSVVEGYKAARTNLMFTCNQEKCPIIIFTSSVSGEGKTTTCANLAITFAQAGLKTLVIDADMRKPKFYKIFKVKASPGLSDVLAGFSGIESIHETSYKNLSIMTSGTIPPNPTELMTSEKMDELLNQLKESYDYIFIDTPPVTVVTDAAVLCSKSSGVVLIARQKYSHTGIVQEAVTALQQVGANIMGIVLNDCDTNYHSYRNGYYKYGYSRYGYSKYGYGDYSSNEAEATEANV